MTQLAEQLFQVIDEVTLEFPVSGPPGKKRKIHAKGLTKKEAKALTKELRAKGTFASIFSEKGKTTKKFVVLSHESFDETFAVKRYAQAALKAANDQDKFQQIADDEDEPKNVRRSARTKVEKAEKREEENRMKVFKEMERLGLIDNANDYEGISSDDLEDPKIQDFVKNVPSDMLWVLSNGDFA